MQLSTTALLVVISLLIVVGQGTQGSSNSYKYNRLFPNNTALLLIDRQDSSTSAAQALGELAILFDLPTIVTYNGNNVSVNMILPNNTIRIKRNGEINAFDNPNFRKALKNTKATNFILAGIPIEILERVALSLRSQGSNVYVDLDALGTTSSQTALSAATFRMVQAGVIPTTWFGVGIELLGNWSSSNAEGFMAILQDNLPYYAFLMPVLNNTADPPFWGWNTYGYNNWNNYGSNRGYSNFGGWYGGVGTGWGGYWN